MRTTYASTNSESQPVISKDNVEVSADGPMWRRRNVDDESVKRAFHNIDDWKRAAIRRAMLQLRQELGELSLDESLVARETIAARLQQILDNVILEWDLTVSQPGDLPGNGNGHGKCRKK